MQCLARTPIVPVSAEVTSSKGSTTVHADQTHDGMMAYLNAIKTVHDAEGTKHPATRFVLSRVLRGRRAGLQAVVEGAMNVSTKNQCFTVFRIAMANKLGSWRVQQASMSTPGSAAKPQTVFARPTSYRTVCKTHWHPCISAGRPTARESNSGCL